LVLFAAPVVAQEETLTETSGQLWGNFILAYPKSSRLYYELDIEPKFQVSGGEPWRNLDATPLVEFYPNSLIDLTAEVTLGRTRQSRTEKSWELTPRIGVRFHLIQRIWDEFHPERIPLSRVSFANLSRLEFRNLWYSGELAIPNSHETRFRNRTELKLAINHPNLSVDGTWYLFMDAEFFVPLSGDVPERFATKRRFRGGLGYRLTRKWRFEVLYIRDFARETLEAEETIDMNALDFRVKLFH
jgi:hypothetical protein